MVRAIDVSEQAHTRCLYNKSLSSAREQRTLNRIPLNRNELVSRYQDTCGPICFRAPEIQSRLRRPRPCTHADGCHLPTERGATTLSFRMLEDRGPFALCGAVSCPAKARATTGFMLSTIDVGIRIVAPRSLVVS